MYQVPVLRGVHHRTVATLHEAHDVFEILELLDTKYANEDLGLDVEASDLYPNQHDWDFTGFSFSVITSMDDKEWVGRSWYFNWKYPARYLNAADRLKLLNWMEKNQERLWAFNNSYELKAFWRVLGKPLLLRDARGLTLAGDVKGSLKALVQRFCGAHEWEVDNGNLVSGIQQMRSALNRTDSDNLLPAIRERRNHIFENDLPLERDIYKFLTPEELKFIENELNFPLVKYYKDRKNAQPSMPVMATEKVLSKEGKKRQKKYEAAENAYQDAVKIGDTPTATVYLEVMQENSLRDQDYEDHEYEVRLSMAQQAVVALMNYSLTEREILETFTGLTGWYGSPTRILGPYCCWDTYYTLVLRKVFGTDPRLENACIYFEQEVRFAGVLESYNQTWDEAVAETLNQNYMKLIGDGQHDCIRYIGLEKCLEWEDEFGCWRELFDALSIGCTFPITVKMKKWVGGFYISTKTANVGRPGLLERHLNAYQETLNGSDELKAAAAQNGLQMLISDSWVPVTPENVRAMPEEMYPIKLRFSIEKGSEKSVQEYDAVINKPSERLAWLKDIWNPASPNREVSDKFWERFLTPRVITANLFYGMRKILMTAQVWDLMEGQMVEIEEQALNPDGTLKFDKEGDPVFKKEKRPCKINILQPDGTIKVVEEFIIDMKDLESTLGNMMALQEMIKPIPFSLLDTTYETIETMTEEEKEERMRIKELHESNKTLRIAIQKSIEHLNDYMDWQTGDGLSGDKVIEQFDVLASFLGLNCDKLETWFDEYRLLLGLRIYKKAYKARNTYIVGAKLGRGQVFEVITPDGLGMDDLPDMWHSHSMPIYSRLLDTDSVGSEEWKEKCDKRLFSLQEQFKPCTTETRRWKSRQHTVPAGSELRRTYVPRRKGWLASHADFSGCELATCAAIADEHVIIKTFQTGGDIHMNTASGVFGKPPSEISPMQRRWAKTCTFLCFHPDTKVRTTSGELTIKDLSELMSEGSEFSTATVNYETHDSEIKKINWCGTSTSSKFLAKITLSDGTEIISSRDHPFILKDGSTRSVVNLEKGDSLMSQYFQGNGKYIHNSSKSAEYLYRSSCERTFLLDGESVEHVHHLNFDHGDDNICNLIGMSNRTHIRYHKLVEARNFEEILRAYPEDMYYAAVAAVDAGLVRDLEYFKNSDRTRVTEFANSAEGKERLARARRMKDMYYLKDFVTKFGTTIDSWEYDYNRHESNLTKFIDLESKYSSTISDLVQEAMHTSHVPRELKPFSREKSSEMMSASMKDYWSSISDEDRLAHSERTSSTMTSLNSSGEFKEKAYFGRVSKVLHTAALELDKGVLNVTEKDYDDFRNNSVPKSPRLKEKYGDWSSILEKSSTWNHEVVSVELIELDEPIELYDMEVEGNHNFLLSCNEGGIYVQNCLYGGTVETLARELGGRMDRAEFVMRGFFATYPNLENYIVSYRRMAVEKGYVFTLNGSPLNLDTSDLAKLNCTSINYPIQSSATNCCGSTFYSMWEALYFKLQLPFVACGFTHDSIDASYPTQAMFLMIPMQKYLAEYIPWKRLGVPARLDSEIGIDSYSLCHVKVLSTITSGNSIDKPHKCEIGGLERNVLPVIELMKEYFDNVEVEFNYGKKKPQSMSELWLGSRAIDDSQLIHLHPGQFDQELEVVITCTNKPDSPYKSPVYGDHEEFNNCITVQAINMLQKNSL